MNKDDIRLKIRLSVREIDVIRAIARRLLGDHVCIRIFGSRVQMNEKGGDIDILLETDRPVPDRVAIACRLTSELQMQLGDQKIDVLIIDSLTPEQPIHKIARQTGVLL